MGNKVFSIRGSNRPGGSYRCRELNEELPSPYYSNGDPPAYNSRGHSLAYNLIGGGGQLYKKGP